ncbi:MAG: hypothetical protein K0S26_3434 [Bacteroidota bacterium]|jgi:hypothetical protein|nr:hypothetical protein [Bacteroidota bacterium]
MNKFNSKLLQSFTFLYHTLSNTILGPTIIGVLIFGLFFDFSIIEPANTAWLLRDSGDGLQSYIGSTAFRMDSWHFPITRTVLINNPEGLCIIYTDSNPLLSILAKLMSFVFPAHYQFYGFWFLLCWILQSVLGYLIIKKLTQNNSYAFVASALFCLLPTQLARLSHLNLVAFWIILWALYVFIQKDWTNNRKQLLFFIVMVMASLVHAYFLLMTLFIAGPWYAVEFIQYVKSKNYKTAIRFLAANAALGSLLITLLWIFGYFYNLEPQEGLCGFGYFSMNLSAPFSAMYTDFSNFSHGLPSEGGQYEGYQYLGFGFFLLLIFTALYSVKNDKPYLLPAGLFYLCLCSLFFLIKPNEVLLSFYERAVVCLFFIIYGALWYALFIGKQKELFYLFIPASLCFVFALSNKIMLGKVTLFEFIPNDDAWYLFLLQSGRSSGRFFWVTALFLLVVSLFLLHRYFGKGKKSIFFLIVIIFTQYADVCVEKFVIPSNERVYESPLDEQSKKMLLASHSVQFIAGIDPKVIEFSLLNNKPINKFSSARRSGALTTTRLQNEIANFNQGRLDSTVLYLIDSPADLPFNNIYKVHRFYGGKMALLSRQQYIDKAVAVQHKQSDSLATLVQQLKTSPLVIIAVKDEASGLLPEFFRNQLDSLYKTKLSNLEFRSSYLAVFSYGKLIEESMSKEHPVEYRGSLLNHEIFVKSGGYDTGNEALIEIDGIDLAINATGLNVAVWQGKEGIWSAYVYNTFGQKYVY